MEIKFVAIAIFLFLLDLILKKNNIHEPILSVLFLFTFFCLIFTIFIKNIPPIWDLFQFISQIFSKNIGKVIGKDLLLNATASGLYITIFFILFIAYLIISERKKWNFFVYLMLLAMMLNGLYIATQSSILLFLTRFLKISMTPTDIPLIYILVLSIPLFFLFKRKIPVKELSIELKKNHWRYLFMVSIFLSFFFLNYHPIRNKEGKIYLFEEGYFNWDKPQFEKYGGRSWGMFGMLPGFLRNIGFEVKKDRIINKETLKETKVLVLINLNKKLNKEEKETIWDFVKEGSSLLCLGDHTGMRGIRDPFNDLLKPYGIEFNFDCGHYLKNGWKNDFEFMNHPINWGLKHDDDTGIGIGASLKTSFFTTPIIVAKYGFSDRGNPNNPKNGYLGDRRYKSGELLGDIVLVAERKYKKGKVLVFGDTSPFQNLSLATNPFFVEGVFRYLSCDSYRIVNNIKIISLFLLVIALTIFFLSNLRYDTIAYSCLLLAILLSHFVSESINKRDKSNLLSIPKIAFIDFSHLERIDLKYTFERSVLGLIANLIRNGYNPLMLKEFSTTNLQKGDLIISIAPSKRFSKKEVNFIKKLVKNGKKFFLSVGYKEKEGAENLLKAFGFDILNIPLGPVQPDKNNCEIRFYNAWPLKIDNNTRNICHYKNGREDYPLIAYKNYGKGKFVVIGDSNFLCDGNLENIDYYVKENILFLKILFKGEIFK